MNAMSLLMPCLAPAAHRALTKHFDDRSIRDILDRALADYQEQLPHLPQEASKGGVLMVHLAALTIGFYRSLLDREVPSGKARGLTAEVTAQIYQNMATAPTLLSRVGTRNKREQLVRATSLFRRFPFSEPSYVMVDVPDDGAVVAFDVQRCPVAEYFRAQDLSELCIETWCNLDFALAERWSARLERGRTLAAGGTHCDFRWHSLVSLSDGKTTDGGTDAGR